MRLRAASATDVGRVRAGNEDAFLVRSPLFAVCDGMGGHEKGEVASRLAADTLGRHQRSETEAPQDWLVDAVQAANHAVYRAGSATGDLLPMGTTITTALATRDEIFLAHVGDSRAYLLHDGKLSQLTDDHSFVAEMVREGRLTAQEAAVHPKRSVITRALGIEPQIPVDLYRVVPVSGDRLLLCTDGLTGPVSDADLERILAGQTDLEAAVVELIDLANANGGEDNITVVLIDVVEGPEFDPTAAVPTTIPTGLGGESLPPSGHVTVLPDSPPTGRVPLTAPSAAPPPTPDAGAAPVSPPAPVVPVPVTPIGPGASIVPEASIADTAGNVAVVTSNEMPAYGGITVHPPKPEPAPPPAALRKERARRRTSDDPDERPFWGRFALWLALVIVLVVGGTWFAFNRIDSAFFVGVVDGNVAVLRGVPRRTFGVEYQRVVERTQIPVDALPDTDRMTVTNGITAANRAEASRIVTRLASRMKTPPTTAPQVVPPPPTTLPEPAAAPSTVPAPAPPG